MWRRAPGRAWRRGGAGALLLLATLAAATSAASAPEFVRRTGDDQLARIRAAIPASARTVDSDDVRIVSGTAPTSDSVRNYVARLRSTPGLTAPTTLAFSVAPEMLGGDVVRPVVRHGGVTVRARLAATDDPAASLVVVRRAATTGHGVWLPEPVATELGVAPGDQVDLLIDDSDATHQRPPKKKPPVVRSLRVDGTYAVAADRRRPADPPGTALWSRRVGGLPTDSELSSLSSYLVVADVATAQATADATGDALLWSVESHLEPGITLDDAQRAAADVADLKDLVRTPTGAPPSLIDPGVISGIGRIVASAVFLRDATAQRTDVLAAAGAAAGLLTVIAVLVLLAVDRRTELRTGAALGLGPVRTAGTWALESLLPVALGAAGGVVLAQVMLDLLGPHASSNGIAPPDMVRAATVVAVGALVLVAVVAATALVLADRAVRPRRSVPWVWLLVVGAAVAAIATATTPSAPPGPVALSTPALVACALGGLAATVFALVARRHRSTLPTRTASVGRWLGRRRAASGGGSQLLATVALSLGLGLVLVTTAAITGTWTVVDDRSAVRAGAASTVQIEGTWLLDPHTPQAPTPEEIAAGKPVPSPPVVAPPTGTTVVWRTLGAAEGEFGYDEVVAIDPPAFAAVADWGSGSELARIRALVAQLESGPPERGGSVPVIAVGGTGLKTGDVVEVSGQDWRQAVHVVATTDAFPSLGTRPMLITSADTFFAPWGTNDPRFAPPTSDISPRPAVDAWLWSGGAAEPVVADLEGRGIKVLDTTSRSSLAYDPKIEAAQRTVGYQVSLALYLVVAAVVVLTATARRSVRRSRAADAVLARVGVGRRGLVSAYAWELVWVVGAATTAAVLTALLVTPLGPALFDLDRTAVPGFEFRITWQGLLVTAAVALLAFAVAAVAAVRGAPTGDAEEVVLRDG